MLYTIVSPSELEVFARTCSICKDDIICYKTSATNLTSHQSRPTHDSRDLVKPSLHHNNVIFDRLPHFLYYG